MFQPQLRFRIRNVLAIALPDKKQLPASLSMAKHVEVAVIGVGCFEFVRA